MIKKIMSGVFTVTLEHPEIVERGNAVRFKATFEHVKDGLIDPTSINLKIYEGDTLKDTITDATKESAGLYRKDFNIPSTYKVGDHLAEWTGTYSSMSILARAVFFVGRTVGR